MRNLLLIIILAMLVGTVSADPGPGWQSDFAAEPDVIEETDGDTDVNDRGPDWGRGSHRFDGANEKRMRKHIEQLRMLKLLEMLDLGEDQEVEFLTELSRFRSDMAKLDERRTVLLDSLAKGLGDSSLIEDRIYDYGDRIRVTMIDHSKAMTDFMDRCREILTPQQFGEMIVFQERFDKQLLERVRAFREGGGPRGSSPQKAPMTDKKSGR